jgi:formylmethanofuran dehydrogenase subunit D
MSYQGPNVSVSQKFQLSPAAVAIEDKPSVDIGTAYDVFSEEKVGDDSIGIIDNITYDWTVNDSSDKVVYDSDDFNYYEYSFYPVNVYAKTNFPQIGTVEIEEDSANYSKNSSGVVMKKDAKYEVLDVVSGSSDAFIPYYNKTITCTIQASDKSKVIATGAALVQSKIKKGQDVFINSTGGGWLNVGTVQSIKDGEVQLTSAYTAAVTDGTALVIGASTETVSNASANSLRNRPNCIYDPSKDFISLGIKEGDVIAISSNSGYSVTLASITNVTESLIKYNTGFWDTIPTSDTITKESEGNFYRYKGTDSTASGTVNVSSYTVYRLVGFSQLYRDSNMVDGGEDSSVQVTKISTNSFSVPDTSTLLSEGDYIGVTDTASGTITSVNKIVSVDPSGAGSTYIYTTENAILDDSGSGFSSTQYLWAYSPKLSSEIVSDYRAIRASENGVVKRIESQEDIENAWGTIGIYNDLAYMAFITWNTSGGRVIYGVNVDSSAGNLSSEYSEALEELKLKEVYSHAIGTTDAGVNGLLPAYVDEQSAPYEAHERIALTCYNENEVYEQGRDTGNTNAAGGTLTISGSINLISLGVTVGDTVDLYNDSGSLVGSFDIASTPSVANIVSINNTTDYSSGTYTWVFKSGRKSDQANRISNLAPGNRRVTVIWPGWFTGVVNGETVSLPPYYISAAIAGMDSAQNPSQSFTNMDFTIPGVSGINLNTNSYFRKRHLDTIGGGGIDVMIQETTPSNVIKSRHDLTSNMDGIEYRERSATKQSDTAAKTIRSGIKPYIGKYNITDSLIRFLSSICSAVSKRLRKKSYVSKLEVLSIQRDPNIADKINIQIRVTIFVAGNYFDVELLIVS